MLRSKLSQKAHHNQLTSPEIKFPKVHLTALLIFVLFQICLAKRRIFQTANSLECHRITLQHSGNNNMQMPLTFPLCNIFCSIQNRKESCIISSPHFIIPECLDCDSQWLQYIFHFHLPCQQETKWKGSIGCTCNVFQTASPSETSPKTKLGERWWKLWPLWRILWKSCRVWES